MKFRHNKYLWAFLAALLGIIIPGCRDDFEFGTCGISDEETIVRMAVDFTPTSVGLTRTGYRGDVIGNVEDLCFVIFDLKGEFYGIKDIDVNDSELVTVEDIDRDYSDTSDGTTPGESKTSRLSFNIDLPLGSYYIYAVANLRKYDGVGNVLMTTRQYLDSKFPENSPLSRREFCELRRSWDNGKIMNNSELTGFVVNANDKFSSTSPATITNNADGKYDLPGTPLTIVKGKENHLHCWLRRMASKVTVTFDASKMSDNISIFIHDVKIHDIVKSAPLFVAGKAENTDSITNDSQYIAYCDETEMNKPKNEWKSIKDSWPELTRSNWSFDQEDGHDDTMIFPKLAFYTHANSAESLFFYENMQGKGESKLQDANGAKDKDGNDIPDGEIDSPDSWKPGADHYKDNVLNGAYVEVWGYYVNRIPGEESEGPIVYRFMLGKNTIDNYDCERNYHYKLTLQFKGRANEVDWHIEYEKDEDDVYIPTPYYISYGYNESLDLPIKVRGKVTKVRATILQNNWFPSKLWSEETAETWEKIANHIPTGYAGNIEDTNVPKTTALGFLTLFQPVSDAFGQTKTTGDESNGTPFLLNYWCGDDSESRGVPLYTREYDLNSNEDSEIIDDNDYGKWSYVRNTVNGQEFTQIFVPLYTRERNLVKKLGYSGQNPYVAYQRRAKVLYEIWREGEEDPISQEVDIIQVCRVENPTGIWRDWNNARSFHVAVNLLDGENNDTYTTLESRGGWSAEVIEGREWILLNGGRQKIYGSNGSKIEFDCKPVGTLTSPDAVRFGIVEVRYHNYSCVHKIFVRQGYIPVQLNSGGPYWHTKNMETKDKEGINPLDEGSMFRFGKWDNPIASSNNYNDKNPWIFVEPEDFKDNSTTKFTMANGASSQTWDEIGYKPFSKEVTFMDGENKVILQDGTVARMMTYEDILSLRDNQENSFAYGVLYGDEATTTLFNIGEVYGYKSYLSHQQYGMRGCFVYNRTNGAQIFFPIGSSGYGRRQNRANDGWPTSVGVRRAVLKYGGNGGYIDHDRIPVYQFMKPLYTLFKSPGAEYWLFQAKEKIENPMQDALIELSSEALGLDINYFSYDFNPAPGPTNLFTDGQSDACFIRLVQDAAPGSLTENQ